MKILIAGSEGSLMQAVIPILIKEGHSIVGVDNFSRYGKIERHRNYNFIQGDLTDAEFVNSITKGVDLIIQGAAIIYGVKGFHEYPADILGKDVSLHQNVLKAALKNNVKKVVYISSSMVYERATMTPSSEIDVEDMQVPFTDYGLSKLVGERLSRAYHKQYGLKYTIWRPFNIITPYEKAEKEIGFSHVFADFIERIVVKKENPLRIIGDGEQIRCFTWIHDVANAIAMHSINTASDLKIYNIGNPKPIKMKDLAFLIHQKAVNLKLIEPSTLNFQYLDAPIDDVKIRIPSIEKISKELGWQPLVSLEEALDVCLLEVTKY
jgi:nucleoside-diphosphate-sugar epimerase